MPIREKLAGIMFCRAEVWGDLGGADGGLGSPLTLAQCSPHGSYGHFQMMSVPETRGLTLIQGFLPLCLLVAHLTLSDNLRNQRHMDSLVMEGLWVKPSSMNEQELHSSRGSRGRGVVASVWRW